jgi:glycerate kinase
MSSFDFIHYAPVMRVLVAPQEFKGSLTASEAAAAIAEGVRRADAAIEIELAPMSDGGAGLVDAMVAARGGKRLAEQVHDPLMRPVRAGWAILDDGTAVIEMAAASGLILLRRDELAPLRATTFGTGELIAAALRRECRQIIVGVGGSATVDAGAGAMQALGARLLDADGVELERGGAALTRLARIDLSSLHDGLDRARILVASDVTNRLCGAEGAAVMFGPQKGATAEDVRVLDVALTRFAAVALRDYGVDVQAMPGSGAAGGLGAGLVLIAGATIEPGFDLVARAVRLAERVAAADLVITGEGRLDSQTPFGKTAAGVARLARKSGKPVGVVAGTVRDDFDASGGLFDAVVAAAPQGMAEDAAIERAPDLVREAAATLVGRLRRV